MGSPTDDTSDRVELGKHAAGGQDAAAGPEQQPEAPFDPYRFGAPDVPPPPEYAPPGYTPPPGYEYPGPQQPTAGANPHGPYPPYPFGTTQQGQPPYGGGYGSPYGQSPYGQSPYGQPPYGVGGPPGPSGQGNGKAVAALVLGIASIALFWTTIFDALFVILALIFGFLGLGDARRRGGRGHGQALAGLICAGIGAVFAIALFVFLVHLADKCGGFSSQNDPGFRQCVRDQI